MKNSHRLPAHVKPERYQIMLKPNLENFTFEGEETIYLTLAKSTTEITLHSADLEIGSAEWIHQGKEVWAGKTSYNKKAETATFTFLKNLEKGKGELKLKFRGILNDKMRGFYRSKYVVDGVDKHLATTQFESTDARRAFPSFDEPSQKAIFDVTLIVPSHTVAISNTIESAVREHESGYKVVEFEPTPKMSTYLLAFIVGDFEYIEGERGKGKGERKSTVRVFTTPGKKEQAKFALDVAIKCLDFYEDYFGIDYPLPVLDLIAIPDFAAGAMENWGAVTYRESTLLIDEERSSTANKQWVAMVIAHELAHQWFGNLVTMEWWTHLWLNEGFASFIEYLAIDEIFPDWDIWTQFVSTEMADAFHLDSLKNTHPIEVEVGHPSEISEIFDKVSYSKGASILRMLHEYLGAKDFQKGLQHYLKEHAYGNAETKDLWAALSEVSGKNVEKIMANWTSKPGHPLVTVREKDEGESLPAGKAGGKLELTQSRFFSSPISKKQTKDNTIWSIPLPLSLRAREARLGNLINKIASSQTPRNDEVLLMDKKIMTIPDKGEKLNTGEVSLVRVDYPHEYLKELEKGIKSGKLFAPDRLGLIRDSFDLAQAGNSPTTLALELVQSYKDEEDYTVWAALTGKIAQLDSLLSYENFYESFKKYGREIYGGVAERMGWEKKKEEQHTDTLLRGMVLNMLGGFGDLGVINMAQKLWSGGKKVDPDLRGVVYNLVAEKGDQKEWNSLVKMYKEEDNQQERDRLGRSLGKFKYEALLEKTLEFSTSKYVRFQNTLGIIASVWANSEGRYLAWEFVKAHWKLLKERYAGGHYFTRVFQGAGEFTKISDARDIESFVKINPVPEAQRTIAQALEQIYSNVEWLKRDRKKIESFLVKMKQ
ncbi:M1 family metallopeptidase [Candidatus Daviesbacteria bacterium]|nr:M1 family metallopeptidase [Candidatus Daviesbacteria bacterium]